MLTVVSKPPSGYTSPVLESDGNPTVVTAKIRIGEKEKIDIYGFEWPAILKSGEQCKGVVYLGHGFCSHTRSTWLKKCIPISAKDEVKSSRSECSQRSIQLMQPSSEYTEAAMREIKTRQEPKLEPKHAIKFEGTLIEKLINAGYHVVGADMPGHGLSGGERVSVNHLVDWYPGMHDIILSFMDRARTHYNSNHLPLTILGSSMGANLLYHLVQWDKSELVNKGGLQHFVSIGGMFQVGYWLSTVLSPFISLISQFSPETIISKSGGNNDPYSWRKEYAQLDPLHGMGCRARMFTEMKEVVQEAIDPSTITKDNFKSMKSVKFTIWANTTDPECHVSGSIKLFRKLKNAGLNVKIRLCNSLLISKEDADLITVDNSDLEGLDVIHVLTSDHDSHIIIDKLVTSICDVNR